MKPIFLTDEDKENMQKEFLQQLNRAHLFDGGFSYTRKYTYQPNQYSKARILYTPLAYVKMMTLLQGFDSEVAWHGMVERGEDPYDFIVYDIVTHKQTVTGCKVDTDDDEYREFLMSLDDDEIAHMCLQAHSHVNMSTTPSGTDLAHQAKIVADKSRKKRGFQIFQIWNKNNKVNSYVYDFDENIYYEDKDVEVKIILDAKTDYLASDFLADAKTLVKPKTTTYQYQQKPAESAGKTEKKAIKPTSTVNPSTPENKGNKNNPPDKQKESDSTHYNPNTDPNYMPRKFTESEVNDLKVAYRRFFNLPADYNVEDDEDWEDYLYYASWGINGGVY